MRFAGYSNFETANGEGTGVSLFTQGCHFHCPGCFNQETWDFDGGAAWDDEAKAEFLRMVSDPHIQRVSILGGEPLADENIEDVLDLVLEVYNRYPDKVIWVYTGYQYEDILFDIGSPRRELLPYIDVLVDGRFELDKRDIAGEKVVWAGSTNQRVIDVPSSIENETVVLYKSIFEGK